MKAKNAMVSAALIVFIAGLVWLSVNLERVFLEERLSRPYPGFLQPANQAILDAEIEKLQGQDLDMAGLERLQKLLWIKKDFFRESYMSFGQRQGFVEKASIFQTASLEEADTQLNVLKYKLGINGLDELGSVCEAGAENVNANICQSLGALEAEVNWNDSCDIGHFTEAKQFCGMEPAETDLEAAKRAVSQNLGACVEHCSEHCFAAVPVYVNGCIAKNENEEYHCLFFFE